MANDLINPYVRVLAPAVFTVGNQERTQFSLLSGVLGEDVNLNPCRVQRRLQGLLQLVGELQQDDRVARFVLFHVVEDSIGQRVFPSPCKSRNRDNDVSHG